MYSKNSDRVLITGGAGFIGSHLVDYFVSKSVSVTVLDDLSTGEAQNLDDATSQGDVRFVRGSILNEDALNTAIQGCNVVYHLAVECVRRSLGNPLSNHEINATGTLRVLETARTNGVQRFVYCSSSEVYGNTSNTALDEDTTVCRPVTVYGAAKLSGELYTLAYYQTYNLPCVIVRPFNAYGPRAHETGDLAEVIPRFIIRIINGLPPVIFGSGAQARDFTYVTDVARGIAVAGSSEQLIGKIVNIARGQAISIADVADYIARICQRPDLMPKFHAGRVVM